MSMDGKTALVTGSSRGIGRGIALKLAQGGARITINYVENKATAEDTLAKVRAAGADGFIIQADVSQLDDTRRLFSTAQAEFGALDIFVSNARPEAAAFFYSPFEITLEQWDMAVDSQAKALLLAAREAAPLMPDGGRILAITYAPGNRTGGLQPWVGMGAAKAALESLVRYFTVALAKRGITVNAISPGWTEDRVLNSLPETVQELLRNWHSGGWTPMGRLGTPARHRQGGGAALFGRRRLDYGASDLRRWRGIPDDREVAPEIQLG